MKTITLAKHLKKRSKEICKDNGCTEENHNCESYAYVNGAGELLDICQSDYFQGSSKPCAAVCLPWSGSQADLMREVKSQCAEMEN